MTRRSLLKTTFAVTAATALESRRVWGANDRVSMGWIGAGGRGTQDLQSFLKQPDVDVLAICDVFDPFRERGLALTEGRAKGFQDFRRLDRKSTRLNSSHVKISYAVFCL